MDRVGGLVRLIITQEHGVIVVRSPDVRGVVGVGNTRRQAELYLHLALAMLRKNERDKPRAN
jgi:predicted RNase H-like HicB family nuclease